MIDSINFILNDVQYLDIARLMALGIDYYPLRYITGINGKMYVKYGNVTEETDKQFAVTGYGFSYNDMYFRYLPQFDCITITANVHKVLGKTDILLSDRDTYISNIEYIVKLLFNAEFSQLDLHRIDYCVDIEMDYKVMYEYIHQLYKHRAEYQHIKRLNNYETSIYITSLYGQKSINIYDKYKCEKDKYIKKYEKYSRKNNISLAEYRITHPPEYYKYKNMFRIEVQNTKKLIKEQSKQLKKKKENGEYIDLIAEHKVNKSLYGYWNKESMQEYFLDFLEPFLYKGTYYKLKKAKNKIKNATTYTINDKEETISESIKAELKEFVEVVNQYGITNAIQDKDKNTKVIPKWCGATIGQYEDDLEELGIDILRLDTKKRKHLKQEKEIIEKSNHSKNWKAKLIEFIVAVGKYGITEITAKNNAEITTYGKIAEHKTWCEATVNKYIEILEALGINPVTLDNDSNFDSLESLYTLADNTVNKKYFDVDILEIPVPTPREDTPPTQPPPLPNPNQIFRKRIIKCEF